MTEFKDGDRVVFFGDSIIGGSRIATHVADCYRRLFPERKIYFFNCGAAGSNAEFGNNVFEEDVLPCNPTHIVVIFGTNDSWRWCLKDRRHKGRYDLLKEKHLLFREKLQELCTRITEKGINLILCTPLPYDEYGDQEEAPLRGGYALLSECANRVREIAYKNDYTLCDIYEGVVEEMQEDDEIFSKDRLHPTTHGGYVMAKTFLKNQGIDIGEEKEMPEYIKEWTTAVSDFRQLYTAECMLSLGPEKPVEERLKKAKEIFENPKTSSWYYALSDNYLKNKLSQAEILKKVTKLYEETVLTQVF